jgi:hypothetical protein
MMKNSNGESKGDPQGKHMTDFIERICTEVGPRIFGTKAEKAAGEIIASELRIFCDEVEKQEFSCHPGGFLDYIWVTAFLYLIGVVLYYLVPLLSVTFIFLGLVVFFVQQNVLWEVVDFLFPSRDSFNVIGKIKPKYKAKQIVLISGHHDSAYEFPLLNKLGDKSTYIILPTLAIVILNITIGIIRLLLDSPSIVLTLNLIQTLLFSLGVPLILVFALFLRTNKAVMGANDNLSAVATVIESGKILSNNRPLETEIWLVSFSGEENMRGSKRFVKRNYQELKEKNAMLFNLEVLSGDEFLLATAEPFFLVKHSEKVIVRIKKAADNINLSLRVESLPFAGSDAANFSRKGLDAAVLFGIVNGGLFPHWHSVEDTPEKIDGSALVKVMELVVEFIRVVDQENLA